MIKKGKNAETTGASLCGSVSKEFWFGSALIAKPGIILWEIHSLNNAEQGKFMLLFIHVLSCTVSLLWKGNAQSICNDCTYYPGAITCCWDVHALLSWQGELKKTIDIQVSLYEMSFSWSDIDHEILSTVSHSFPLFQEGQLLVSGERNRLCTSTV